MRSLIKKIRHVLAGALVPLALGLVLVPLAVPFLQGGAVPHTLTAHAATADGGGSSTPDTSCGRSPDTWDLCITNIIYVFTVGLMSTFAYAGAYVFDLALHLTLQSGSYSLYFISWGWAAVRDLANMLFIFILVYIAYSIILRAETAGTMKTLAGVVVMALLVNFSFFFTRVVIDGGNILAVQFYNAIDAKPLAATAQGTNTVTSLPATVATKLGANTSNKDLTANIMQVVKVTDLFNTKSFTKWYEDQKGAGGFLTTFLTLTLVYVAVGMIFAILAFMFFTVGFKFLQRMVILWFVIISAPLAFAARAVSVTKGSFIREYFDRWFSMLIENALYPAIFLFLFIIINQFMIGLGCTVGTISTQAISGSCTSLSDSIFKDLSGTSTNGTSFVYTIGTAIASIAVRLGIIVIMLYFALRVSDFGGKQGSAVAKNFGKWVGGKALRGAGWTAGAATFGAAGAAGRGVIGQSAKTFSESTTARSFALKTGLLGRSVQNAASALGKSSFDARNTKTYEGLVKKTGLGLGTGWGKDGWSGVVKARAQKQVARATASKPNEGQVFLAKENAIEATLAKKNPEEKLAYQKLAHTFKNAEAAEKAAKEEHDLLDTAETKKALSEARKARAAASKAFTSSSVAKEIETLSKELSGAGLGEEFGNKLKNQSKIWSVAGLNPRYAGDKEAARQILGKKEDAAHFLELVLKDYKPATNAAPGGNNDAGETKDGNKGKNGGGSGAPGPSTTPPAGGGAVNLSSGAAASVVMAPVPQQPNPSPQPQARPVVSEAAKALQDRQRAERNARADVQSGTTQAVPDAGQYQATSSTHTPESTQAPAAVVSSETSKQMLGKLGDISDTLKTLSTAQKAAMKQQLLSSTSLSTGATNLSRVVEKGLHTLSTEAAAGTTHIVQELREQAAEKAAKAASLGTNTSEGSKA